MSYTMDSLKATKSGFFLLVKIFLSRKYEKPFNDAKAFTLEQFRCYQQKRLDAAIRHCVKNVPHYRDSKELYMKGDEVLPLTQMPVLTKQSFRENTRSFYADAGIGPYREHATSGTSGTPLVLRASHKSHSMVSAGLVRFRSMYGIKPLHRTACLTGFFKPSTSQSGQIAWRDYLGGQFFLSIYQLCDERVNEYAKLLERFKPVELFGYASTLYLLAQLFKRNNIIPPRSIKVIVTTSEVMYPAWKECLENVFQAPVADQYGSQELQCLMTQCPEGSMHINPEFGVVEVVDEHFQPVPFGQEGQLLLTGLANDAMPLVRYQIGDRAKLVDPQEKCQCGLEWPSISPVLGRSEDAIITPDGCVLMYLNFHCTKEIKGIVESQFIQDSKDHIKILLVVDNGFDSSSAPQIKDNISRRAQFDFNIDIEYVKMIPRGPRGKFKAVLNLTKDKGI